MYMSVISTNKKVLSGVVVSDKMDKTIVVKIDRYVKNQKYQKFVRLSKKIKAHDPENRYHIGDTVEIRESRPYSKDKHFEVIYQ